ncbi:hypothetical protein VMCG_01044 [Cytospora schulzeri]|uniref:Uncharacterized protein n=1 Tax=Cytospora schulzeri TaxID=448051 RepID=A0A423X5U4_9PEZI|nr:hypothetical protein VMCG_01044 [Valsa malicola]
MSINPIDTLGLSCPNGGEFYVCQNSEIQFLGCCASDPCADGSGSCPKSDLRYSSFDTDNIIIINFVEVNVGVNFGIHINLDHEWFNRELDVDPSGD